MLITARGKFCWREYFVTPPTVTLDGVEQRDCLEADDEAGYVIRYKRGEDGRPQALHDRYRTERVRGVVVITGQRKTPPEERLGRAQTKRDRRMMKRVEIAQRQQICGE